MSITSNVKRIAIFTTGVAIGLSTLTSVASAEAVDPKNDPRGNNGTIKVDGIDYDDTPGNEPHVDCVFSIDFFGFDQGDVADIRFFAQPPTGDHSEIHTDLGQLISVTPAGGGQDVDASIEYDATKWFVGMEPAKQGYHVKVEANVVGAPGGAKQKVFWIDCSPEVPEEEVIIPEEEVIIPVEEVIIPVEKVIIPVDVVVTQAVVESAVVQSAALEAPVETVALVQESPRLEVQGVELNRPEVLGQSFTKAAPLARTGVETSTLVMLAGLLLALGTILTRFGRAVPAVTAI